MFIQKDIPIKDMYYYEKISPSSVCFDIETTGLHRQYSHTTVIGAAYIKSDSISFCQWLLDDPRDEDKMLAEFSKYLKNFDSVIQFNGNAFDIPYITQRCKIYDLPDPFDGMALIDLYRSGKMLSGIDGLENLKQKSFESLFDISRRDKISGRECIYAYNDYIRYRDLRARDALLLHNEDDVLNLLKLYPLSETAYISDIADVSINYITEKSVTIVFKTDAGFPFEISRSTIDYSLKLKNGSGILTLFGNQCERFYFFENYKDYYYLPDEDRAIHKSVGAYVDPSHRRKAKRTECCEKCEGVFFRQFDKDITPAFRETLKDKSFWFRLDDIKKASDNEITALCRSYLKHIFKLNDISTTVCK